VTSRYKKVQYRSVLGTSSVDPAAEPGFQTCPHRIPMPSLTLVGSRLEPPSSSCWRQLVDATALNTAVAVRKPVPDSTCDMAMGSRNW
jgi:hypothetical protein